MMSKAVTKSFLARFHKWILLLGVLLIIIVSFLYIFMFRGMTSSSNNLFILSSQLVNGGLLVSGSTASSANGFSGYSFEVQDGKLMLKVRYVPIANHWHPSGDFHIQLSANDLKGIKQVFLYKEGRPEELLWSQAEGVVKFRGSKMEEKA
jgi:hypothetical protein